MADGGEEDPPVILDRSSRATRGKRMTKLLDDELEEDEAFWNQDALKEEVHDVNYEEEPEVADEFDSDFADEESEPDDEAVNIAEDRLPMKKRLIFPGKTLKKKNKKKVISKLEKDSEMEKSSDTKDSIQLEHHDAPDDLEGEKIVRKSTRTSVVVRQAERDAIQAALQATTKPIKRKKEGEEKRMTQEEMLLEAAQTGISHLEFSNGASFESGLSTAPIPYPQKSVCAVTGLPARYRDPKTGLPYANKEAFKIIRERQSMDHEHHEHNAPLSSDAEGHRHSSIGSSQTSKRKKRGASQGPPVLPEGKKRFIHTNEIGLPNKIDKDTKALATDISLQVRETLPVGYATFEEIPSDIVNSILGALKDSYVLKYVADSWLEKKLKKSWRDKRYRLRNKYIKGKNVAEVKAMETPDFVTREDWQVFINMSITEEFKTISERNIANRSKLDMPNASGRHTMAQICHRIATEKNLASDAEVGRTEVYIACHTRKDKAEQSSEKISRMKDIMSEHPEARLTGDNDALTQVLGKDTRGCARAIGPGVSPNFLKNSSHMVNKLVDSQLQISANDSEVEKLRKEMAQLKDFVTKEMAKSVQERSVVSSRSENPSMSSSSLPPSQDVMDIGKKCQLYGWGDILVAYGEVHAVDPNIKVHTVTMGEGNYKVFVETALVGQAPLFRANSQVEVVADVVGSYTVWPKRSLKFSM